MDQIYSNDCKVIVLAATNCPEAIDESLFSEGRFGKSLFVPLPQKNAIRCILKNQLQKMPCSPQLVSPQELEQLVEKMKGFCGADIKNFCRKASFSCIKRQKNLIEMQDFDSCFLPK